MYLFSLSRTGYFRINRPLCSTSAPAGKRTRRRPWASTAPFLPMRCPPRRGARTTTNFAFISICAKRCPLKNLRFLEKRRFFSLSKNRKLGFVTQARRSGRAPARPLRPMPDRSLYGRAGARPLRNHPNKSKISDGFFEFLSTFLLFALSFFTEEEIIWKLRMTAPEAGRRSHDQRHPITCFRWGSYCTADGFCAAGTNQQRASTAPLRLKSKAFHRSIGSKTFDGKRTRIWTNGKRASHSSMRGCFRSSTRTPNAPSRPSAPFSSLFPREQARKSCSQKITSVRRERPLIAPPVCPRFSRIAKACGQASLRRKGQPINSNKS